MWSPCTFTNGALKEGHTFLCDCLLGQVAVAGRTLQFLSLLMPSQHGEEEPCLPPSDSELIPELGAMDSCHVTCEKHPLPKDRQQLTHRTHTCQDLGNSLLPGPGGLPRLFHVMNVGGRQSVWWPHPTHPHILSISCSCSPCPPSSHLFCFLTIQGYLSIDCPVHHLQAVP